MNNFKQLGIDEDLLAIIEKQGFTEPTEIQEKAIPPGLAGKDVIAMSATGSGKTLAFASAFVHKTNAGLGIQVLILTPTRELADQVAKAVRLFSSHKRLVVAEIIGGVGFKRQVKALKRAEVVVATPGRLLDHLSQGTIRLSSVKVLVIDEADRMLDMGFIRDVEKITARCPRDRQTLLFSATMNNEVRRLSKQHMRNPVNVAAKSFVDPSKLKQVFYVVPDPMKFSLLVHLIKQEHSGGLVMVFCNTRRNVDRVQRNLMLNGVESQAIHGGHTQSRRSRTISAFHSSTVQVMVCTDVAARGLDIKGVEHIYNYDIPRDPKDYIHRIGRTARAGEAGRAINIVGNADQNNFRYVLRAYKFDIAEEQMPNIPEISFQRIKGRIAPQGRGPGKRSYGQRKDGRSRSPGSGSGQRKDGHSKPPGSGSGRRSDKKRGGKRSRRRSSNTGRSN
ncbi:DEAD/DEAH box helicase [archaeon]|nr:DEAD/DEAH box helicase [archaeon]